MAYEKQKTEDKEKEVKKLETLQDYKDDGWKVGSHMKTSYPPVYILTKDGKTIQFRPKMKDMPGGGFKLPERVRPETNEASGGIVKRYKGGLMKKPKLAKGGY